MKIEANKYVRFEVGTAYRCRAREIIQLSNHAFSDFIRTLAFGFWSLVFAFPFRRLETLEDCYCVETVGGAHL
jgi:hypothetical protein